jgi:hypothetical protein
MASSFLALRTRKAAENVPKERELSYFQDITASLKNVVTLGALTFSSSD